MNIFVLDENPMKAAQMLCDCHLRKMCVETAQILSGVMLRRGMSLLDGMPKPQNINHPVIAAADYTDAEWVAEYNYKLHDEYCWRFDKWHKYARLGFFYYQIFGEPRKQTSPERLCKCCGDLDVVDLDIVTAYRRYYTEVKKPQLQAKGLWKFTNREDWTNEQ